MNSRVMRIFSNIGLFIIIASLDDILNDRQFLINVQFQDVEYRVRNSQTASINFVKIMASKEALRRPSSI